MNLSHTEDPTESSADRVRRSTPLHVNLEIDRQTDCNIQWYVAASHEVILERIRELDKEWDVERVLEANTSSFALTGLLLGLTADKRWFMLTGGVLAFLLQHALQGWCPPLPLLRRLGVRTRGEIDREKYALRAIMGRSSAAV
jgi:hypothetical protein